MAAIQSNEGRHSARRISRREPQFEWSNLRIPFAILGLALVARISYWVLATPNYAPQSDAAQYDEMARHFADGKGFALQFPQLAVHPTAFRPPLYPALLGTAYRVFGQHVVVGRIVNLLLGLAVVALTMVFAQRIAGARAAVVAGVLVSLYPVLVVNDITLLTEPLSLCLLLVLLIALSGRRLIWGGVACGLLILARPSAQGLLLVIAAWLLWRYGWKRMLVPLAVAALVVTPWVARNWIEFGQPLLVTSNGFNMAAIYSPAALADNHFVDPTRDPRFNDIRLTQFDEAKWQNTLQQIAWRSVRHDPSAVAGPLTKNTQAFFELRPALNKAPEQLDGRSLTVRNWSLPLFYLISLAGVVGLVRWRRSPEVVLLAGTCLLFSLASIIFVAPPRLRAPFDLMCCIAVGLLFSQRETPKRVQPSGSK